MERYYILNRYFISQKIIDKVVTRYYCVGKFVLLLKYFMR